VCDANAIFGSAPQAAAPAAMIRSLPAKVWERHRAFFIVAAVAVTTLWVVPAIATAATAPVAPNVPLPQVNIGVGQAKNPHEVASALQILLLLTVLTLAPTLLVLVTSFTRVIVVLSFVRTALG